MSKTVTDGDGAAYAWWFLPVMYVLLVFCVLFDVRPADRFCDWLIERGARPVMTEIENA